jgi:hypothetical protein
MVITSAPVGEAAIERGKPMSKRLLNRLLSRIEALLTDIGSSPTCIRSAFRTAAGSIAALALSLPVAYWLDSPELCYAAGFVALSLILLWLLHVVVYGVRSARFRQRDLAAVDLLSKRRAFLIDFARGAAWIAMASGIAFSATPALAVDCGSGIRCNPRQFCCYYKDRMWCCPDGTFCAESRRACSMS